jgi:YhcH/YjgK/YiaL family protein
MAIFGPFPTVRGQAPRSQSFEAALAYAAEALRPGSEAHARLLALPLGETARIELGGGVHAMEQAYRTRARAEGRWESHRAHVDLQLVLAGEELIEVAAAARLSVAEDLTPGKDVLFYAPAPPAHSMTGGGILRLGPGDAALLFPDDAHLTAIAIGPAALVRKTVVKIPVAG